MNLLVGDVSVFSCGLIDFTWKSQSNLLDVELGQIVPQLRNASARKRINLEPEWANGATLA